MLIGIDARMYGGRQTGIGNYIHHLTRHLFQIDKKNDYVLFFLEGEFSRYKPPRPGIKKVKVSAHWYTLEEQLSLPRILNKFPFDLVHFPHFNAPVLYHHKYILTIHDITQKYFPGPSISSFFRKQIYELVFSHNIKKAKKIISVSHYTKKDILANFSVDPEKIQVIYEGFDPSFRKIYNQNKINRLKKKYGIKKPFILYAGVFRDHKNIIGLIQAFDLITRKYKQNLELVLIGSGDSFYVHKIQEAIKNLKLNNFIVQPGFLPQEQLILFYNAASLFILPSFREGFGFPPLEAMGCETPVVASCTTSLPEVLGKAACYFNPYNISEMAAIAVQVLKDKKLQKKLINLGRTQIQKFSWQKCAEDTLKLYEQVVLAEKNQNESSKSIFGKR